jgi:hypothetical protein
MMFRKRIFQTDSNFFGFVTCDTCLVNQLILLADTIGYIALMLETLAK